MFNLRDFINKGLISAVGKMADYQVILNAVGWLEKGVLTEEDLAEINGAIEAQYVPGELLDAEEEQDAVAGEAEPEVTGDAV